MNVKHNYIVPLFLLLLVYDIYRLFSSIIYKASSYFIDGIPFVAYHGIGFQTSGGLVVVLAFLCFYRRKLSLNLFVLFIITFLTFIISPITTVSKTSLLLVMFELIMIAYIFFHHTKSDLKKMLLIGLFIASIPLSWMLMDESFIVSRFNQGLSVAGFTENKGVQDGSTNARIGEIKGAIENITGSWHTFLFGMGNGAWIASFHVNDRRNLDSVYSSGLDSRNYRNNGKYIHHIHSGIFAILNRNGAIGLVFYIYFFYFLLKQSWKLIRYGSRRYSYFRKDEFFVYAYGLGSISHIVVGIVSFIPSAGSYGEIGWGSRVAMVTIAMRYLINTPRRITPNSNILTP